MRREWESDKSLTVINFVLSQPGFFVRTFELKNHFSFGTEEKAGKRFGRRKNGEKVEKKVKETDQFTPEQIEKLKGMTKNKGGRPKKEVTETE